MSVRLMSLVWEIDLPDSEKIVLLALADNANDEGGCWPSVPTIARKCSKGERTVQAALKSLEIAKHISRVDRSGTSCMFYVHPRSDYTPAAAAPRDDSTPAAIAPTPAAAAPKPSRTIKGTGDSARATRLPDDWKPARLGRDTAAGEIVEHRGQEWAKRALESFRNHWRSANGPNAKKLDWQATWANWIIEQDRRDGRNGQQRTNGVARNNGGSPTISAAQRFEAYDRHDGLGAAGAEPH